MTTFANLEELIAAAKDACACLSGIAAAQQAGSLQRFLETCPVGHRLWALEQGWVQFAEHCNWETLRGFEWTRVLSAMPQFAENCDWGRMSGWNWVCLLRYQPQFAEHCDWEKLDGWDWVCLLRYQPLFAEHCDWEKLDGWDWSDLLRYQPQLAKYRPQTN